jgi:hypothetical protein
MWAWIKSLPSKFASLKKLVIDPIDQQVCIVRSSGVAVLGVWLGACAMSLHAGHVDLEKIALSGSSIVGTVGAAVTLKSHSKRTLS